MIPISCIPGAQRKVCQQQEEDYYAADFTAQERSSGAHSAVLSFVSGDGCRRARSGCGFYAAARLVPPLPAFWPAAPSACQATVCHGSVSDVTSQCWVLPAGGRVAVAARHAWQALGSGGGGCTRAGAGSGRSRGRGSGAGCEGKTKRRINNRRRPSATCNIVTYKPEGATAVVAKAPGSQVTETSRLLAVARVCVVCHWFFNSITRRVLIVHDTSRSTLGPLPAQRVRLQG